MPIFNPLFPRAYLGALAGVVLCTIPANMPARALDIKEDLPKHANGPGNAPFPSVGESLKAGLKALSAGESDKAVGHFNYAAQGGNIAAQWKLARMYAAGEGVPRSDLKAYQHYRTIVEKRGEDGLDTPTQSRMVAEAFVALGQYHLVGIADSPVRRDTARAGEFFHYAAAFYNHPEAQYQLGLLLVTGIGRAPNPHQAARWFYMAAEQGQVQAQARLGHLLFNGEGVPKQIPRGLMLLDLATRRADSTQDAWIGELYQNALTLATDDEKALAEAMARKHARHQRLRRQRDDE